MDHTFELLNPRDYLRLLHGVYFDGRSIPLERNPARLIKLAIQGVVLVILLNALLVLALTLGGATVDWAKMATSTAVGMAVGV